MKEIQLTQGKTTKVDDVDYESLNQYLWQADPTRHGTFYVTRKEGNIKIYMHRAILGAKFGELVDHKDGNSLNNQRYNIRLCTLQENNRNKPMQKNNQSGYKGVCFDRARLKWQAQICVMQRPKVNKFLGRFNTAEEAAEAYKEAAEIYFGEFAYNGS